ncbi:MAG: ABC transporter ATP-binding protein/permease [Schleiferilactobacillus harbinensis]|jgi:ATP-binding cassette subfamily B protein|nr:ABC transporter ATP-binding protein/permease [Schleiferilactobacillus harbinensis]
MKKYRQILAANKGLSSLYCAVGILIAFLTTLNVHYFQNVLDQLPTLTLSDPTILVYLATLILIPIIGYFDEYAANKLPERIYYGIKQRALEKMDTIEYQHVADRSLGTLLQLIENGASAGRDVVFAFAFQVIRDLAPTLLFSLIFIGAISTKLIWFIMFGYVLVFAVTRLLLKWLYSIKTTLLENQETINQILTHSVMAFIVYRVTGRYRREIAAFHQLSENAAAKKTEMALIHESFFAIFALLVNAIKGGVIVLVITHHLNSLSIGALVALLLYIDNIYSPIAIFNVIYVQAKLDDIAYTKLNTFFESPDDQGMLDTQRLKKPLTTITFTNLRYANGSQLLFDKVNVQLEKGQIYYLIGKNGTGKSTLINILMGFIKKFQGQLTYNDQTSDTFSLRDLYAKTSYLAQNAPVFAGTLRDNIDPNHRLSDLQITAILEQVALAEDVAALPAGLATELADFGANLSGGQRQKIAFARLLADASHTELVIMDEATAALDKQSRTQILTNIAPALAHKIVLIVTHRTETIPQGANLLVIAHQQIHQQTKQ